MRMLRPRQIQEIWGISVGSWRHAQRTLDLKPVALRFGGKPLYDEAVIVEKFGKPVQRTMGQSDSGTIGMKKGK